ncbi:MAG: hypothetical protein Q7T90_03535 [Thiobacillus sp.]|nr:hypothetical protein [Thiobacillus sp.]
MKVRSWRQRILFASLAVTIALSVASGKEEAISAKPVSPLPTPLPTPLSRAAKQPAQTLPRIELERLQRQAASAATDPAASHTFRAMSWYVPPPPPPRRPPPKPLPPPPPTAPPMPFSFMGLYEEDGVQVILLIKGDRIYTVSVGEVIDSIYRVERLNGGQLEVTYLPLNIKQSISAGGAG